MAPETTVKASAGPKSAGSVSSKSKIQKNKPRITIKLRFMRAGLASDSSTSSAGRQSSSSSVPIGVDAPTGVNLLARDLATTKDWEKPGYLNQFDEATLRTGLRILINMSRGSESWLETLKDRIVALEAFGTPKQAARAGTPNPPSYSPLTTSQSSSSPAEEIRASSPARRELLSSDYEVITLTRGQLNLIKNSCYSRGWAEAMVAVGDERYAGGFAVGADAGFFGGYDAGFVEGEQCGWARGAQEAADVDEMYMGDGVKTEGSKGPGEGWSWWAIKGVNDLSVDQVKAWILRMAGERHQVLEMCEGLKLRLRALGEDA